MSNLMTQALAFLADTSKRPPAQLAGNAWKTIVPVEQQPFVRTNPSPETEGYLAYSSLAYFDDKDNLVVFMDENVRKSAAPALALYEQYLAETSVPFRNAIINVRNMRTRLRNAYLGARDAYLQQEQAKARSSPVSPTVATAAGSAGAAAAAAFNSTPSPMVDQVPSISVTPKVKSEPSQPVSPAPDSKHQSTSTPLRDTPMATSRAAERTAADNAAKAAAAAPAVAVGARAPGGSLAALMKRMSLGAELVAAKAKEKAAAERDVKKDPSNSLAVQTRDEVAVQTQVLRNNVKEVTRAVCVVQAGGEHFASVTAGPEVRVITALKLACHTCASAGSGLGHKIVANESRVTLYSNQRTDSPNRVNILVERTEFTAIQRGVATTKSRNAAEVLSKYIITRMSPSHGVNKEFVVMNPNTISMLGPRDVGADLRIHYGDQIDEARVMVGKGIAFSEAGLPSVSAYAAAAAAVPPPVAVSAPASAPSDHSAAFYSSIFGNNTPR